MKLEIKRQWIAALQSGDYAQGQGALHRIVGGQEEFCCLGVLCNLAVRAGVIDEPELLDDKWHYGPAQDDSFLPTEVQEWADLEDSDPHIDLEDADDNLAALNDEHHDFDMIAGYIEEAL